MRIGPANSSCIYDVSSPGSGHPGAGPAEEAVRPRNARIVSGAGKAAENSPEEKHVVTMMAEALEQNGSLLFRETKGATSATFASRSEKPRDTSSQLTGRLVGAKGQFEVRQVIAEASTDLVKLRVAAASLKGAEAETVMGYIRRLEKLIARAGTKIKALDKEDMMEIQKAGAQKKQLLRRVEEIKAELRKKRVGRGARENGYLIEGLHDKLFGRRESGAYTDDCMNGPSEAQIAAQAAAIAAAEGFSGTGAVVDGAGMAEDAPSGGGGASDSPAGSSAEDGVDIRL